MTQGQKFATPEEALAHYGVKGMRWGVRNDKDGGGSGSGGKNPSPVRAARKGQVERARAERSADKAMIKQKGQSIGGARRETREVGKAAHEIIREYRRAPTPAAKKAAAKRYDEEVKKTIESPEFKAAYQKANTMGKGEMALHVVAFGPLAAVTIPTIRKSYSQIRKEGYELEVDMAHDILKEMRS
jgi:hypothetical protein